MQPSSDAPQEGPSSSLRRYGPIAAIVVVLAIIAAVVFVGGGDEEEDATTETTAPSGERPEGAISFSQAEEQGLDVTFQDGCDEETGRVAMPSPAVPECFANVDENGGATSRGVTADTIKVVAYVAPENDAVLDFVTAAIANDDTNAQAIETFAGYVEMFQRHFQTYGRTVEVEFLQASGPSQDEVAARADAERAVNDMGAFAVIGGPALTSAWTERIKELGAVCVFCFGINDPEPSTFSVTPSAGQSRAHIVEYVSKKLVGKPAEFAGDAAYRDKERVFGHLTIDTGSADSAENAKNFRDDTAEAGVELAEQLTYTLNPATLQEQAGGIITKLKDAGITTVIFSGDPVAPGTFTRVATSQEYFPEWVIGPSVLVDVTAFARTYDQQQWAHAFGISYLTARIEPEKDDSWALYEWFKGTPPPADDTAGVIIPGPLVFFSALQAAGPNLTPETFRDGIFSLEPFKDGITISATSWGDHGIWPDTDYQGLDDYTEIWWDPEATGLDELRREAPGMYQYVNGGTRYLPGEWTTELKVFDPDGAVAIYDERPEGERAKDYPSPAK